jgi:hypothetical protein
MQAVKSCSRDWFVHEFLSDGFANAIAMYAVSSYALKTGDKNMESGVICDKLHTLSFYRNIFRSPKAMQPEEKKVLANYYAGTAAFLVAEQKHGREIYRQMLDSKNPHELLVEMVCERSEVLRAKQSGASNVSEKVNLGTKQGRVTMVCGGKE